MRVLGLAIALLLVPVVGASWAPVTAPTPYAGDEAILVSFSLETGEVYVLPVEGVNYRAMADACSTASPAVTECTGALSPHAALAPPPTGWLQATLYPREIVSLEGGSFDVAIEWASGTVGVRCTVPPTTEDPGALFGIACADFGPFQSYDWRDEPWTLRGSQTPSLMGSIQYTVLYAQ